MSNINLTNLRQLLADNGVQGSPLTRNEIGTIARTELGAVQNNNGRLFYQVGDFRIMVRSEALNKDTLTIVVLKATRAFGKMQEGQCFAVAE